MSANPGEVVRKSKHNIAQKLALNHEETKNKIHTKYKLSKYKCQYANFKYTENTKRTRPESVSEGRLAALQTAGLPLINLQSTSGTFWLFVGGDPVRGRTMVFK